jgi:hypothetical protein
MKRAVLLITLLAALSSVWINIALAQAPTTSSSRIFYTQKAILPRQGALGISTTGSFGTLTTSQFGTDLILDYTLSRYVMMYGGLNIVQSNPTAPSISTTNVTDYLRYASIGFRTGSYGVFSDRLQLGTLFNISLPVNGQRNQPFLYFPSSSTTADLSLIGSFYFDKVYPRLSGGLHFNAGLRYVSLADNSFALSGRSFAALNDAVTTRYVVGFDVPLAGFLTFFIEDRGEFLLAGDVPAIAYGRDAYNYLGGGFKLQIFNSVALELGGEYLLTGNGSPTTDFVLGAPSGVTPLGFNQYPDYRFYGGLRFDFSRRRNVPNNAKIEYAASNVYRYDDLPPASQEDAEIQRKLKDAADVDSLVKVYQGEEAALASARKNYEQLMQAAKAKNDASSITVLKDTEIKLAQLDKDALATKNQLTALKEKQNATRKELKEIYAKRRQGKSSSSSYNERLRAKIILDAIDEQSEEMASLFREIRRYYSENFYGKLFYELTINKNGNVDRVRLLVSSFDEGLPAANFLEEQVAEQLRGWKFPPGDTEVKIDILRLEMRPDGKLRVSS